MGFRATFSARCVSIFNRVALGCQSKVADDIVPVLALAVAAWLCHLQRFTKGYDIVWI